MSKVECFPEDNKKISRPDVLMLLVACYSIFSYSINLQILFLNYRDPLLSSWYKNTINFIGERSF